MLKKLEKWLMPVADVLGRNKVLIAIRDGFLFTSPLVIVGSIFLLLANFPIEGWSGFWAKFFGEGWEKYLGAVTNATFSIVSLSTVIGVSYAYARELGGKQLQSGLTGLVAYLILTPTKIDFIQDDQVLGQVSGLSFGKIGNNGIFLAMIVGLLSAKLLTWVYNKGWTIKMPAGVPPAVVDSFAAIIPSGLVMLTFFIVNIIFLNTSFGSAQEFIYTVLQAPLVNVGNTLGSLILYSLFSSLFWMFGINGPAVTNSIWSPIFRAISLENIAAYEAKLPLPHIFTGNFVDFFQTAGGGGSTLSLVIVMLLFAKSERIKQLGKLSLVPGIFGINEPLIFGLPVVLNPIIAIPFILTPIVNTTISYIGFATNFIPKTSGITIPWATPPVISGYLTTGSWRAAVLQLVFIIIGCFIYYPFIKILDKKYIEEEKNEENKKDEIDDLSFDDLSIDDL